MSHRRTRSLDIGEPHCNHDKHSNCKNKLFPPTINSAAAVAANSHELRISPPLSLTGSPSEVSLLTLPGAGGNSTANRSGLGCEMCANYEHKLQQLQESERRLRHQANTSQSLADRYKSELSAERLICSELESRMEALSRSVSDEGGRLGTELEKAEKRQQESEEASSRRRAEIEKQLQEFFADRRRLDEQMERLRNQYDKLLGRHRTRADQMQREPIDLPQTVDELQLACLQLREELIEERAAREHLEESLKSEVLCLRDQMAAEQTAKEQMEQSLSEEINALRTELAMARSRLIQQDEVNRSLQEKHAQLEAHRTTIDDLEKTVEILRQEKLGAEASAREYRQKANLLQQELDTCEQVQKDFVRLSQSLQIELEKIRQADNEVRWQDEDDVLVCNGCKQPFTRQRRKGHCRHCGRVFCESCIAKTVPTGPQHKPASVCDVCHTLLVRDTAPYFSSHVPTSSAS